MFVVLIASFCEKVRQGETARKCDLRGATNFLCHEGSARHLLPITIWHFHLGITSLGHTSYYYYGSLLGKNKK